MNISIEAVQFVDEAFRQDVLHGLAQTQKAIPCKWFYDEAGSQLFEAITKTQEYYPTRVETRLLKTVVKELAELIPDLKVVIEPGSGASVKTRLLLSSQPSLATYIPIDISAEFLNGIAQQLQVDFPHIQVTPLVGDFTQLNIPANLHHETGSMVFFPGSTIGNFSPDEALALLKSFHHLAGEDGWLLIGVDSTQNAQQLLAAYDDSAGITAAFNKNLLVRANRELEADFDLAQFAHQARFNQAEGKIEMHLVSRVAQTVTVAGQPFSFAAGESIFTENCYKYTREIFLAMANACNWQLAHVWQDESESEFELFLLKSSELAV